MKKRLFWDKRAEMTAKMLVTIIIIAVGFVVLLIVYSQFLFTQEIDKEVCHESILARHTFNYGPFEAGKVAIPLKCQTEKVCFSEDESDCPTFGSSKKDDPVTSIKVSNEKDRAKSEALDVIAEAMYDCHSMLGEGKLNFVPRTTFEHDYCLVCSRFAFDENLMKNAEDITYGDLYKYLELKKTPEGKSYLEYLYKGWSSWDQSAILFQVMKKNAPEDHPLKKLEFEDWKIDPGFKDGYAIVAQISPARTIFGKIGSAVVVATGIALTIGGTILTATGFGAPLGVTMVVAGIGLGSTAVAGGVAIWYSHDTDAEFAYSPPTIYPYDVNALRALGCEDFATAP